MSEKAADLVVVLRRWWWRTQWSKFSVTDTEDGQSLAKKVVNVETLELANAAGLLVWYRKNSRLGSRVETLVVTDAVVKVFCCG